MYGKQKLLASRIPLAQHPEVSRALQTPKARPRPLSPVDHNADVLSTPANTEGESASDTELDTETEMEYEVDDTTGRSSPNASTITSSPLLSAATKTKTRAISQHDLLNRYFRNDTVMLHNLDPHRLVIIILPFKCADDVLYSWGTEITERRIPC